MKTLRISENAHRKLTRWLGQMMAHSGKAKTYSDVIEALVSQAVLLSPELVERIDEFIEANKKLGYVTREEFLREAVNEKLTRPLRTREQNNEGSY